MKKKCNLFEELVQGIEEINQHLEGKITLKTTGLNKHHRCFTVPLGVRSKRH
jgi:hypothetical protein